MSGDLDAIREDVAMAARSAEMARHVALDHAPELLDEVERLRAEVERLTPRRVETTEWTVGCPIGGTWIPYGSPPHRSREDAYNQAVGLACIDEARGWEVRSRTVTAWLPEVSS